VGRAGRFCFFFWDWIDGFLSLFGVLEELHNRGVFSGVAGRGKAAILDDGWDGLALLGGKVVCKVTGAGRAGGFYGGLNGGKLWVAFLAAAGTTSTQKNFRPQVFLNLWPGFIFLLIAWGKKGGQRWSWPDMPAKAKADPQSRSVGLVSSKSVKGFCCQAPRSRTVGNKARKGPVMVVFPETLMLSALVSGGVGLTFLGRLGGFGWFFWWGKNSTEWLPAVYDRSVEARKFCGCSVLFVGRGGLAAFCGVVSGEHDMGFERCFCGGGAGWVAGPKVELVCGSLWVCVFLLANLGLFDTAAARLNWGDSRICARRVVDCCKTRREGGISEI